jgi:hypothetical protein
MLSDLAGVLASLVEAGADEDVGDHLVAAGQGEHVVAPLVVEHGQRRREQRGGTRTAWGIKVTQGIVGHGNGLINGSPH